MITRRHISATSFRRLRRSAASAALALSLASTSLAQTTRPAMVSPVPAPVPAAAPIPPAVGQYDHDPIRRSTTASPSARGSAVAPLSPSNGLDLKRVTLSLGIVLALILVFRWLARFMFPAAGVGRSSQVIKVLSRSVVAPKQQFLLVQIGRRLILVGDCGTQMNAITEITDPDEVASLIGQLGAPLTEPNTKFGPLLGRAREPFDEVEPAMRPLTARQELLHADDEAAEVTETSGEITGLTEKIRLLSRQLGRM